SRIPACFQNDTHPCLVGFAAASVLGRIASGRMTLIGHTSASAVTSTFFAPEKCPLYASVTHTYLSKFNADQNTMKRGPLVRDVPKLCSADRLCSARD